MKNNNIKGFSIVELMISLAIGLIILTGLVTVFDTVSNMNRTQNGLARLQENGRYAMTMIKQNLEQSGYQYCLGSSLDPTKVNDPVYPQPWVVFTPNLATGMPDRSTVSQTPAATANRPFLLDTAYFLHGHECTSGGCDPSLTSLGSIAVPSAGIADGDRVDNTDVLTFRYISGKGDPVNSVSTNSATGVVTIQLGEDSAIASSLPQKVVIPNCKSPAVVVQVNNYVSATATTNAVATANIPANANAVINMSSQSLARMFSLDDATSTITYYVANNIVDGRDIPTLYSINNGTTNALVQGVDRFDVLYGVRTNSGNVLMLNASEVENLTTTQCVPTNRVYGTDLINVTGCGWRSVVSIEVHLLLNTIYNSSNSANEQFVYSIDGNGAQTPSSSPSEIKHYRMFRREFVTTVTLKNY